MINESQAHMHISNNEALIFNSLMLSNHPLLKVELSAVLMQFIDQIQIMLCYWQWTADSLPVCVFNGVNLDGWVWICLFSLSSISCIRLYLHIISKWFGHQILMKFVIFIFAMDPASGAGKHMNEALAASITIMINYHINTEQWNSPVHHVFKHVSRCHNFGIWSP